MAAWHATGKRGRIGRLMPALVGRRSTSWLVTVTLHGRSKGVSRRRGRLSRSPTASVLSTRLIHPGGCRTRRSTSPSICKVTEGFEPSLSRRSRSGRTCRRKKGPNPGRGTRGRISERHPEVEDRAVPGHWEGDLVLGRSGRSQVATLVERTTGFVVLVHLPGDRKAETVRDAMQQTIATLPEAMLRSITSTLSEEQLDDRRRAQRKATRDARLAHAIGEVRRACCNDRLSAGVNYATMQATARDCAEGR